MKKYTMAFILSMMAAAISAVPALAITNVLLSPTNVNVNSNQAFTLTVTLDPQGESNYTNKLELNFPFDLVEVKSFAFSAGWVPVSQPGYDLVDNSKGVLIKTGGYPGGISAPTTFGTVTFSAKKTGTGLINVSGNSLALDAFSKNVLASQLNQISIKISSPPPVPAQKPVPQPTPKQQLIEPASPVTENQPVDSAQTATAIQSGGISTSWILLAVAMSLIAFGAGILVGQKTKFNLGSVFKTNK